MREVLLSGYGRVYLTEMVSEFGPKPDSLVDFHTAPGR